MGGLCRVDRAVGACGWCDWKDAESRFASMDKIWISLLIDFFNLFVLDTDRMLWLLLNYGTDVYVCF